MVYCFFFFFKQKTAYEMLSGDWSSDVCSSDLHQGAESGANASATATGFGQSTSGISLPLRRIGPNPISRHAIVAVGLISMVAGAPGVRPRRNRSSEWAPATPDLVSNVRLGRSSECV